MTWDVLIIGGGPAGSMAAAELARRGYRVGVLERKAFPRAKLCGEFLAPQGVSLLQQEGILDHVLRAGARPIYEAAFVSPRGRSVRISLDRFPEGRGFGLGLSRATLDHLLLERARAQGARVLEGVIVTEAISQRGCTIGVTAQVQPSGKRAAFFAAVVIDASGRSRALASGGGKERSHLFAFQVHLSGVEGVNSTVELYGYPSGYGGILPIENGLYNLCGLTTREVLRRAEGRPERLLELTFRQNPLARERLWNARSEGSLRGCGPLRFGPCVPPRGHLVVGDAFAQMDPFLGQGISVAMESGLLAARLVDAAFREGDLGEIASRSARTLRRRFARLWSACWLLRPIASLGEGSDRVISWLPQSVFAHPRVLRMILGGRSV